jgi:glycosyltransferase involved in cell wall biosynthesis
VRPGLLATAPQCGLLAARQDGAAFAEATLRLTDDAELGRRFAQAGRAKAESDYGSEAMFEAYDALLWDLGVAEGRDDRRRPR